MPVRRLLAALLGTFLASGVVGVLIAESAEARVSLP